MKKLLIICGQEGTGKSTLAKKILPHLKLGASFDAENIAQVNPFEWSDSFQQLVIDNTLSLINNFFDVGFGQVVAGSFLDDRKWFDLFKTKLKHDPKIYIVMLTASKEARDKRRLEREKPTTKEMMDWMDNTYPQKTSLKDTQATGGYEYFEIDNSNLSAEETIAKIKEHMPDFFN